MKIVLASQNAGKIKEFKEILSRFGIEVLSLKDIDFHDEIIEDGTTFEENAVIKAKTIYNVVKIPVIADDSGICVDYLSGAPGIYSARYGGVETDTDRNLLLLKNMEGVTERNAHFHCSLVLYLADNEYVHFKGIVEGVIDHELTGGNGFGYDVLFIPDGYTETFGILPDEIKNKISHRAKAINQLVEYLENDFNR